MADHYSLCLLGLMDRLWFHKIILFSESSIVPKTLNNHQIPLLTNSLIDLPSSSLSLSSSSSSSSTSSSSQEEISIDSPPRNLKLEKNYFLSEEEEREEEKEEDKVFNEKERKTRFKLSTNKTTRRSQSFSPSKKNRQQQYYYTSIIKNSSKLQKSMSCRSLRELEMEEVKGFMDLGFIFKKEHINPRMVRVIPGLTRLGLYKKVNKTINHCNEEDEDEDEDKEIIRPYLSEAWLIRKPDSPLLNLRLPRVYAASDMKKHLKSWARTVASVIQQES